MKPTTILLLRLSEPGSSLTVTLRGSEVSREGRIIHRPEIRAVNDCYRLGLIQPDGGKFVITEEGRRTALQNRNKEVRRGTKRVVN